MEEEWQELKKQIDDIFFNYSKRLRRAKNGHKVSKDKMPNINSVKKYVKEITMR